MTSLFFVKYHLIWLVHVAVSSFLDILNNKRFCIHKYTFRNMKATLLFIEKDLVTWGIMLLIFTPQAIRLNTTLLC